MESRNKTHKKWGTVNEGKKSLLRLEVDNEDSDEYMENILGRKFFGKYTCIKKLGEGSFGRIYKAEYNGEYFALKFESIKHGQGLLESEAAVMNYLKGPNIPFIKSYGVTDDYNVLVMQLLGKSLEDIFEERKKFSLKTVCMIATQMITALEYIHNKHIVHRDIKPDNFVMGLDDLSYSVFLLDFGLAKKYRSSHSLIQYPMVNKKKLTGTARYASINALNGFEQSRRDDLEACGYVLMYFLRGSLPWQGLPAKNKEERYKKIMQKKKETKPKYLCEGFPKELETYVEYTRNMEYEEEPDYDMLRGLFMKILKREGYKYDYIYDWTTPEEKKLRKAVTMRTDIESQNMRTTATKKKERNGEDYDNSDEDNNKNKEKIYRRNSIEAVVGINDKKKLQKLKSQEIAPVDNIYSKNIEENDNNDKDDKAKEVCCSSACNIF